MRALRQYVRDAAITLGIVKTQEETRNEIVPEPADGLSLLKPAGTQITPGQVLDAKARVRAKPQAEELPPLVERPHICEDLYGSLDILRPDNGVKPQILEMHVLQPRHPHTDKRMVALTVKRGKEKYRLLLYLADAIKPVLHDTRAQKLDFFSGDERVAMIEGRPLKLRKWEGDEHGQDSGSE